VAEPAPSRAEVGPGTGASLCDVLDRLLAKGVAVQGDLVISVAGVDLIELRLCALLGAVDTLARPRKPLETP
jgi:gas vesicle structural protein